jgi:protease PrsW
MYHILLLVVSLLPGVLLMLYILYMDRNEKEPLSLVLKAIMLGAISTLIATAIGLGFEYIHPIFAERETMDLQQAFLLSFLQIGPVEEFSKLIVILLFIWKRPEFNEENDGIVYVGASALGFAMFENILYVFQHGMGTGILRAFTAIPLHCFTGVIMGYYTGLAKFSPTRSKQKFNLFLGFAYATFFHAIYDTFALSGTELGLLILPTVILLVVFGVILLGRGHKLSLARWGSNVPTEAPVVSTETGTSVWKVWVSRPILLLVLVFWVLLISSFDSKTDGALEEIILGGIILTFLPALIGSLLELSYFFSKRKQS